jgi:hypothetical protein
MANTAWPIVVSADLAEAVLDLVLVLGLEAHAQRPRDGLQSLNLLLHNQLILKGRPKPHDQQLTHVEDHWQWQQCNSVSVRSKLNPIHNNFVQENSTGIHRTLQVNQRQKLKTTPEIRI